ncbi:Flavonol 7-O-beta-glucosyltransferase UGT74F1 [Linum perenne]
MTHCGWNSTLKELRLGVSLVANPQWTDQATNAKYIDGVWKLEVGAMEKCSREVMDGEQWKEIVLYDREHPSCVFCFIFERWEEKSIHSH